MNCGRSLKGGLSVAGWEIRVGALGGGLPVRAFRQVAICTVVPLVPTGVCCGGFLLERVLGASVGCFGCGYGTVGYGAGVS